MRNVVLIDGVRTGFCRMGKSLSNFYPSQLAGMAIKGLLDKTNILKKINVDSVILGAALEDAHSYNIARLSALYAGLPYETSASFVEMQCGSAIESINLAALKIKFGAADVIIAGGCESHSQRFAKFSMSTEPFKLIPPTAIESVSAPLIEDRVDMITISDNMAKLWNISREECDEFALRSQIRADKATKAGYFTEEIIPVTIPATRKTPEHIVDFDEHLRPDTTIEGLARLKSVYTGGVTTAGNASGLNDGAAVVLLMEENKAKELGYAPKLRWVCGADVGVDPKMMGIGPAYSFKKILDRTGLKLSDIDVIECNEAFAAQNLAVIKELENLTREKVDQERWNPNGGAIAFGHPNGASGARICIFAMKELIRGRGEYALIGSCCGGGLGVSALIEQI
jgi:acetyl-CoA acetyltransferase family protein